jgi:hypothetical protein
VNGVGRQGFSYHHRDQHNGGSLDDSIYTALENHKNLIRYTVCLPLDRSDARGKKSHKSFLELWDERVQRWQKRARSRGLSVEFVYWGDHELHTRLSKEEHAGRYKFWFNKEFLSDHWFATPSTSGGTKYSRIREQLCKFSFDALRTAQTSYLETEREMKRWPDSASWMAGARSMVSRDLVTYPKAPSAKQARTNSTRVCTVRNTI